MDGERDRLLRVSLAAKGQHQARWRSMRVCSADHQDSRVPRLSGSFQARAYFDTVNPSIADRLVAEVTNSERVILNDVASENARKMFYALTMLLQGPLLLQKVESCNGFEAWRLLVERY